MGVFMRRYRTERTTQWSIARTNTASLVQSPRSVLQTIELSAEQTALLSEILSLHSAETFAASYRSWGLPWTGFVSQWDWSRVVRKLLGISREALNDDALYAAWTQLDPDCSGQAYIGELLELGHRA